MKVLVIDDNQVNLASALQTLIGHEVTLCSSHDEAEKLLVTQYKEGRDALEQTYKGQGMDNWKAYQKAKTECELPYWDAVLCDLLMPAGKKSQAGPGLEHVGKEMPVGWSLALRAAMKGAKYVAVASDMNHHDHPASAMLDHVGKHRFNIDGARVLLTNYVNHVGIHGSEVTCSKCSGTGIADYTSPDGSPCDCVYCKKGIDYSKKGKDWGEILARLLAEEKTSQG